MIIKELDTITPVAMLETITIDFMTQKFKGYHVHLGKWLNMPVTTFRFYGDDKKEYGAFLSLEFRASYVECGAIFDDERYIQFTLEGIYTRKDVNDEFKLSTTLHYIPFDDMVEDIIDVYDKLRSDKNYKDADMLRQLLLDNKIVLETLKDKKTEWKRG